jgi:signal transduction histidine kinase
MATSIPGYFGMYVEGNAMTNAALGMAFAVIGGTIAWVLPRNPIGWLLITEAWFGGAFPAFGDPYGELAVRGHDLPGAAWAAWLSGWTWSVAFLLGPTVVLTLWPSGRVPGRLRLLVIVSTVSIGTLAIGYALSPEATLGSPQRSLGQPIEWQPARVIALAALTVVAGCLVVSLAAALRRLSRAASPEREQLGWYLFINVMIFVSAFVFPSKISAVTQSAMALTLGAALLWYGMMDLRLVLRRTIVYSALTACVAVVYAGVSSTFSARFPAGPLPNVMAAAIVTVGLIPLRDVLQRGANHLVYGDRRDPVQAVAKIGEGLSHPADSLLAGVADAVAAALRSPYVAIQDPAGRILAQHGTAEVTGIHHHSVSLDHLGVNQGRLLVVSRTPDEPLDRADTRILHALRPHVALAVRAAALTADLQRAREQVVAASLAERDRLRRDLHDGLGPALGGLALGLEAAESLIDTDPPATREILSRTRTEAVRATMDIRRIIDDLRPDILDEAGLVGALRLHAELVGSAQRLTVRIHAPETMPPLDPQIELAAYRITREAITNVVRHSGARSCDVRVTTNGALTIEVHDDGHGFPSEQPGSGVGLNSIRQRATACGGTMSIEGSADGTCLRISLPMGGTL